MDVSELFSAFMSSGHGQQAMAALGQQGIAPGDAQNYLGHAISAAHEHVNSQAASGGLFGDHPGRNFFAAFASGILKGDGLKGSLEDGAAGVLTAKITEVLCTRAGLDPNMAGTIAATATPYIMGFLRQHLGL